MAAIARNVRVSIRFKPAEGAQLKAVARARGETVAELVRRACSAAVFRDMPAAVELPPRAQAFAALEDEAGEDALP
jgi:hypothetical protein